MILSCLQWKMKCFFFIFVSSDEFQFIVQSHRIYSKSRGPNEKSLNSLEPVEIRKNNCESNSGA